MEQNYTHYKGSDVEIQLMNILNYCLKNLNEIEMHYYEWCHDQYKNDPNGIRLEEYTNMFSFGSLIMKNLSLSKKDAKNLTIDTILYNYYVINQRKLDKQFRKRKKHNCIHNKIRFYAYSFLKEFMKVGAVDMSKKYEY